MSDDDERLVALVHDLRTPLTIVQGFADLLARRGATLSEDERNEYVARIAAAAGEMKAILDAERAERLHAP
jgi:signal transduction histidine kinase